MKLGFSPQSIVDIDGMPLVGRVTLYAHDSDTKIDVYTLEGDAFVQAANPQLLDNAGRLPATLFYEASIVDVKVEKYIGAEGQMSVSSPDSDFETFDSFEIGFSPESLHSGVHVDTIAELEDTAVSSRVVTVLGYHKVGDCMPRMYYWDKDSVDEVDGGYVVGSNEEDSGRWILLWTSSIIPGSLYGIVPGTNESNIGAFLSYPSTVGSFLLPTASVPFIERGEYSSSVLYSSTRSVSFDAGAKFPTAAFSLPSVSVVGNSDDYISDFAFTRRNAVAHSSWFKTAKAFLRSGAKRLVVDSTNYFTDSEIDELVTVSNCTLEYPTNTRLAVTYGVDGRILLSNVNLVGVKIFNATDKVTFNYMEFTDAWFSQDGALIDFTDKVLARTTAGDTLLLANFASTAAYINATQADGQTVLDLAGRKAGNIAVSTYTEIRNLYCDLLNIQQSGKDVKLSNVHCPSLVVSCRYLTIADGSDVNFLSVPILSSLTGNDSRISSGLNWKGGNIPVSCTDCYVGIAFDYSGTDNESTTQPLYFFDCQFVLNASIYAKRLYMYRCVTQNNAIKIYPYKDNGEYYLDAMFEGNCFDNNAAIEFTKHDIVNDAADEDCYNCMLKVKIVGNQFRGNSEGVKMRYWQNRSGTYGSRVFVKESSGHDFEYRGNCGNCPAEGMSGVVVSDNTVYTQYDLGGHYLYKYSDSWKRVAPNPNTNWYYPTTEMCLKYYNRVNTPYDDLSFNVFAQDGAMYYRKGRDESVYNGDFFALGLATYDDYIRVVQSGAGDHNTGILARIV